jgi:hypothetical protein
MDHWAWGSPFSALATICGFFWAAKHDMSFDCLVSHGMTWYHMVSHGITIIQHPQNVHISDDLWFQSWWTAWFFLQTKSGCHTSSALSTELTFTGTCSPDAIPLGEKVFHATFFLESGCPNCSEVNPACLEVWTQMRACRGEGTLHLWKSEGSLCVRSFFFSKSNDMNNYLLAWHEWTCRSD